MSPHLSMSDLIRAPNLLGCAPCGVHALLDQVAPDLGDLEHGANLAVEQADDGARRPARREHAPPAYHFESREPGLVYRRDIGHRHGPLEAA